MLNDFKYYLSVIIVILTNHQTFSAICGSSTDIGWAGDSNGNANDNKLDSSTGKTYLLYGGSTYIFTCCGYIEEWNYATRGNTGTLHFQVWRDTSASVSDWTLVGEDTFSQMGGSGYYNESISPKSSQIFVRSGDVIGMHFPSSTVLSYKDGGDQHKTSTVYTAGTSTFDWNSVSNAGNRRYVISATVTPASAPSIDNLPNSVTFADTSPPGTLLFTLTVSDADFTYIADENLTTSVVSNNGSAYFEFDNSTLQVTTKGTLMPDTYSIDFEVVDSCSGTGTGTLTIIITNIPPVIHNLPATYELSEDASSEVYLYTVNVTDTDPVNCSITSPAGVPFSVKNDVDIYFSPSGTWPYLTYSITPQYVLTVQCTDGKDPVSNLFTVDLIPNLPPTINNLPNYTSLIEDQVAEQLLYTLNITDPTNDPVTCSVSNPASSPFYTKPISGTSDYGVYVQYNPGLNHVSQSQYDLTIACADSRTTVTGPYTVLIIENQAPVITNLDNSTSISSLTTGIGHNVFQVVATDNENDQLYFNMTCNPASCPFIILASGDILVNSMLYGTTISSYQLQIYVYDLRTLVGPNTLTVQITDINNQPSFSSFPVTIVNENSALGASVYQVTFSDPDASDSHIFTSSFDPTKGATYFKVDINTGLVSLSSKNVINYEALNDKNFNINISVFDGHTFTSQTLVISIADVNEAPEFDKSFYLVSGDEGIANSALTDPNIQVFDPDSGDTLYYTMDCGAYQGLFSMDSSTGNVSFGPPYDLDTGIYPSSIICNITVSDGSLTDNAQLLININEVNDNLPQFSKPTYIFYVSAEDGIGTLVGSVAATDADAGIYGFLTYSLNQSSAACECFLIAENGAIYVKNSLSNFTTGTQITVTAIATDGGNSQDTATVIIHITPAITTVSTTTTDRYRTFFEDARNSIWLVVVFSALLGLLVLLGYYTCTYGWLDSLFRQCAERIRKPVKRPRRSPQIKPERQETESLPSVGELSWEPWKPEDFITSVYS